MSTKLDGLLPIHAARERRALRVYHEHSQVYELALSAQMSKSLALVRMQQTAKAALVSVLEGGQMSAGDAQATIEQVKVMEVRIKETTVRLEDLKKKTQIALDAAREAKRAYAMKVRTSHKLRHASDSQNVLINRAAMQREEQRVDDDFSPHRAASTAHERGAG